MCDRGREAGAIAHLSGVKTEGRIVEIAVQTDQKVHHNGGGVKYIAPLLYVRASLTRFSSMSLAQGGPPFRSDHPDTPGNRHWKVNTVLVGERNPSEGLYSVPNIDVNYGLGNRILFKYELPLAVEESRGPSRHVAAGLGNSLLPGGVFQARPFLRAPSIVLSGSSNDSGASSSGTAP